MIFSEKNNDQIFFFHIDISHLYKKFNPKKKTHHEMCI